VETRRYQIGRRARAFAVTFRGRFPAVDNELTLAAGFTATYTVPTTGRSDYLFDVVGPGRAGLLSGDSTKHATPGF
jgi:hypothetical protein